MRQHDKSRDRQEARLDTCREASAHQVAEALEAERLARANAPILASIAELEAELANPTRDDFDSDWECMVELDRDEEMGFQSPDDLYEASLADTLEEDDFYDPEWDDDLLARILFT